MVLILVNLLKIATILGLLCHHHQPAQGNATEASLLSHSIHSEASSNQTNSNDLWSMVASMRDASKSIAHTGSRQAPIKHAKFHWNINLDQHGRYQLNWRVNYAANKILFALEINTSKSNFTAGSDIFALGFSERGELASSDFCLIWFDLSHRIHLQDARIDSDNLLGLVDSSESVCKLIKGQIPSGRTHFAKTTNDEDEDLADELASGLQQSINSSLALSGNNETSVKSSKLSQEDEIFEILFKRPLDVCGRRDEYYAIDNGTTHMVWFTLKGPVLSLDRLNLTELQHESALSPDAPELRYVGGTGPNFEHGLRRAQLIAAQPSKSPARDDDDDDDVDDLKFEIRMNKFQVQPVETTYWCKLFKLPEKFESRRFHITSYEAVIEPGNEHVVHHMELFNCPTKSAEQRHQLAQLYQSQGGWSGECSSQSRPSATEPCRRVILAWAMGAKPLVYPEQVGQSIGGPDYSPYVVLEVHYNNVELARELVDSSGLRFHYSAELRPFDAGVLEVGLEYTNKNSIPPKMVAPLAGYCVSECTRAALSGGSGSLFSLSGTDGLAAASGNNLLDEANDNVEANRDEQEDKENKWPNSRARDDLERPDSWHNEHRRHHQRPRQRHRQRHHSARHSQTNGQLQLTNAIYIFAAQMHTHLTGVASWTEHVRGGRVLRELQRDDHYSPHFQEIRLLPEPVRIEPGDALVHYCLYDTRARVNITLGGHATTDEMCVTYLHYYPKIDLEVCKSSVDSGALEQYFAYMARDELQATSERLDMNFNKGPSAKDNGSAGDESGWRTVSSDYHSIDWTPRRARELIEFYSAAPLSVQCNRSDGSRWPGNWNGIEPTRLVKWPDRELGPEAMAPAPKLDYFERPSSWELIAYRGSGHQRRHAQCSRK